MLLDFQDVDPRTSSKALTYIEHGETLGLAGRFKCRTRTPWYRVPIVRAGDLLLAKRSHRFPRMVVNEARAITTDTIYRGRILDASVSPRAFTAAFPNSLTLLGAELEGRSFGGGVLELVPSEIRRLPIPDVGQMSTEFGRLDQIARSGTGDDLVRATDAALIEENAISADALSALSRARVALVERRLRRNGPPRNAERTVADGSAYEAEMSIR